MRASRLISSALILGALGLAYWQTVGRLVHDWATDDNYSHGFLIIPLALYFAWERRSRLAAAPAAPSWVGLIVVLGGLALLVAGTLGAELFTARFSVVVVLTGIVLFVLGWHHLRVLAFPLAFLVLMIPLPSIIFNQIAFPLQLLASRFGESVLQVAHVPVLREGNIMILADTTLEVAEACSGIRSLISLLTVGIVYGYFVDGRAWVRTVIALSTIPIAILANGVRVAGTGLAAHYYGPEAAEGFFHTFSGWLVFLVAFVMLFGLVQFVQRVAPSRGVGAARPAPLTA